MWKRSKKLSSSVELGDSSMLRIISFVLISLMLAEKSPASESKPTFQRVQQNCPSRDDSCTCKGMAFLELIGTSHLFNPFYFKLENQASFDGKTVRSCRWQNSVTDKYKSCFGELRDRYYNLVRVFPDSKRRWMERVLDSTFDKNRSSAYSQFLGIEARYRVVGDAIENIRFDIFPSFVSLKEQLGTGRFQSFDQLSSAEKISKIKEFAVDHKKILDVVCRLNSLSDSQLKREIETIRE